MNESSKTQPKRIKKTLYINIAKDEVYVEAFLSKKAADHWANFYVKKPAARLKIEVEYEEGEGVDN